MAEDFLAHYAAPLKTWLDDEAVVEICVNGDGRIWIERTGAHAMTDTGATLEASVLDNLGRFIAGKADLSLGDSAPLASAVFVHQDRPLRAQVVTRPAVRGIGALAIRKYATSRVGLDRFAIAEGAGLAEDARKAAILGQIAACFDRIDDPGAVTEMVDLAIEARLNVLISGGTSSGKTTFLRAMLDRVPTPERIVTIEDVPEIFPGQPNTLELICDRQEASARTPERLIEAVLRLRPDRLFMGELRGAEARMYLEAINTGHPGSISTMHANSAEGALQRLSLMVRRSGSTLTGPEVQTYVASTIDLVIQLDGRVRKGAITGFAMPGAGSGTSH